MSPIETTSKQHQTPRIAYYTSGGFPIMITPFLEAITSIARLSVDTASTNLPAANNQGWQMSANATTVCADECYQRLAEVSLALYLVGIWLAFGAGCAFILLSQSDKDEDDDWEPTLFSRREFNQVLLQLEHAHEKHRALAKELGRQRQQNAIQADWIQEIGKAHQTLVMVQEDERRGATERIRIIQVVQQKKRLYAAERERELILRLEAQKDSQNQKSGNLEEEDWQHVDDES